MVNFPQIITSINIVPCILLCFSIFINIDIIIQKILSNIAVTPDRAQEIVLAACALHNFLRHKFPSYTNCLLDREDDVNHEFVPGTWRSEGTLESVDPLHGNTSNGAAKKQREYLCDYVNGPGAVSWQDRVVTD